MEMNMKKNFYKLIFIFTVIISAFQFVACNDIMGYSVLLWNEPEYKLQDGDIVPVYIRSNISSVYVVGVTDEEGEKKIELPLWQLTEPVSKRKVEQSKAKYAEYAHNYAFVKLDGLPCRAEPVNTAKQVYRLRKGEIIKIGGNDFVITDTSVVYASYDEYIKNLGIEKKPIEEYKDVIDPDFSHDPKVDESMTVQWHKYYFSEFDDFIESYYSKNKQDVLLWLYFEKGIEECKYLFSSNEYYYKIYAYEQKYGKTPTDKELAAEFEILPNMDVKREEYRWMYEKEFYSNIDQYAIHANCYLVSDNDYIKLAKKTGQTHPSATLGGYGDKEMYYEYTDEFGNVYISDVMTDSSDMYSRTYTVIHSTDPDLTDSWIRSNFSNIEVPHEFMEAVITPSDVFDDNMESMRSSILRGLITMAVALVLLSVCMYFIMRSALMNRIKEVGIYRAIFIQRIQSEIAIGNKVLILICFYTNTNLSSNSFFVYRQYREISMCCTTSYNF